MQYDFRPRRKAEAPKRSNERSGDIIVNGNHHLPFDAADSDGKKSVIIYGTAIQNKDFFSRAVPYSSNSFR